MSEEKHFVTGEHPTVVHDTGPVSIWVADVVADVHMHEALRAHRPASLAGRGIRVHQENASWFASIIGSALVITLFDLFMVAVAS